MAYTEEFILNRLREHCINNLGSVWTMHKPTWQGVTKRMNKDEDFAEEVRDIVAEANHKWERLGINALLTGDESFNVNLFKHYTQNKKPFIDHNAIELEERIQELENAKATK